MSGTTTTWLYGYDGDGRLDAVTENGNPVASYGYDQNGNRVSVNAATIATYDNQDRLLTFGSSSYAYNANGELLTKTNASGTTSYTWDALGNLLTAKLPNGEAIQYLYDGQGRLVGKEVNGTLTEGLLYDGQLEPVAELDGSGNIVEQFVYGTRPNVPDYIMKGGVEYRVVADQAGSPVLVVNASTGAVAEQVTYDAWGNVTSDSNPGFQPFGFAGGLYDRDTGLVRFGARDYDPQTGRWISKDPLLFSGGDTELYAYSINDPVNFIDFSGLVWTDAHTVLASIEGTTYQNPSLRATTALGFSTNMGLFVALPSTGLRGKYVELEANGKCLVLPVGDVGPWNGGKSRSGKSFNDPYWINNAAPETSTGVDLRGRVVSRGDIGAGIDISAAAAEALGLTGNVQVTWRGLPDNSSASRSAGVSQCGCSSR